MSQYMIIVQDTTQYSKNMTGYNPASPMFFDRLHEVIEYLEELELKDSQILALINAGVICAIDEEGQNIISFVKAKPAIVDATTPPPPPPS